MSRFKRWLAAPAVGLLAVAGVLTAVASPALAATCTTSSSTGACGPYTPPTIYNSSNGADLVVQNDFSAIPQTLTVPADSTSWTVSANTNGFADQTSVKSYPATQVTYTTTAGKPDPMSDFGQNLTSNWTNTNPSGAGQDYEYAFDDWLANPAQPSWTNDMEVMIWTDNHGQRPAGSDTGTHYTDAAGVNWEVWTAGGASSVGPVGTVSFVRATNAASGSIDRMGFYNYLKATNAPGTSTKMLSASAGVDQLNYGLEICGTGGAQRTYGVSGYSISKTASVSQAPDVVTGSPSGISQTAATLNGTVNPNGAATTYQFQWGPTTSYGSTVPASPGNAGSGSAAVAESAALTGLSAGTTYHYRLSATNATGTTNGSDQSFTTTTAAPAPVLSGGHATSNGNTRETVDWTSTVLPGRWRVTIVGPNFNGVSNVVPVPEAVYSGLSAGHTYTVTVQQLDSAGNNWGASGKVVFVTTTG